MLISSHLLFTMLISKLFSLKSFELYIAILAGVAIDIDHLFINKKWISDSKNFFKGKKTVHGINQHSWLQEPLFGFIVSSIIGLILYFWINIKWWILPFFLLTHIVLDALMQYSHYPLKPFNNFTYKGWIPSATKWEFYLSALALLIYFIII